MVEDEERQADEVNIAFQMGAEWQKKRSEAAWKGIHEGAVLALQERIKHLEEMNLKASLIKVDDMTRIIELEGLLRSFPGFTDDASIGDPWIESVRSALEGKESE